MTSTLMGFALLSETFGDAQTAALESVTRCAGPASSSADQLAQIGGMLCHGVVFSVVGPRIRAVVARVLRDKAVALGKGCSLGLPEAQVDPGPVHQDDRDARALLDVAQLGSVDPYPSHR